MGSFDKDPDAVLDYGFDWSDWLDDTAPSVESIVSSAWLIEEEDEADGLEVDSDTRDATSTTVWVSGGIAGKVYHLTNHIVTTDGREDDRTHVITITGYKKAEDISPTPEPVTKPGGMVIAPVTEPISVKEASRHLNLDYVDEEDVDLARTIRAARRHCENFQNRAYVTQTRDHFLDKFPIGNAIKMPYAPLQSVATVKYKDASGILQTWDAGNYIVDTISDPGRIVLANGKSWPSTLDEVQAVQIRFICGYGDAEDVPDEVKQAILLKVADLWENRGDVAGDSNIARAIEALLWPERIIPV